MSNDDRFPTIKPDQDKPTFPLFATGGCLFPPVSCEQTRYYASIRFVPIIEFFKEHNIQVGDLLVFPKHKGRVQVVAFGRLWAILVSEFQVPLHHWDMSKGADTHITYNGVRLYEFVVTQIDSRVAIAPSNTERLVDVVVFPFGSE